MTFWDIIEWYEEHKGIIFAAVLVLLMAGGFLYHEFYLESEDTLIGVARVHEEIINLRDLDDYEKYLAKYPKGKYASEAEDVIVNYYSNREIFSTFSNSSNIPYLEERRDKFPKSNLGSKMQRLIDEKVSEAYRNAEASETISAWEQYKMYVTESYWRDADKQIEILNQRWNDDSQAWAIAQTHNDLVHYEEYIKYHPQTSHASIAEKRIIDLTVATILDNNHGVLPKMQKTKNYYSSKSTINIYNDTDYSLTVFFSGRSSKKITLIPHLSQTIDLVSGEYSVAARVDDARRIRPYAGKETLTGGEYSERFYIETTTFRR